MKVIITSSKTLNISMYLLQTACFTAVKSWNDYIKEVVVLNEWSNTVNVIKQLTKFAQIPVKMFDVEEDMMKYADALLIICEKENEEITNLIKIAKKKELIIYVYRTTS